MYLYTAPGDTRYRCQRDSELTKYRMKRWWSLYQPLRASVFIEPRPPTHEVFSEGIVWGLTVEGGTIISGGVSDWTKCLDISNEDNRVSGAQTTISEDMEPDTMDRVSVQIKDTIRGRQM